MMTLEELAGSLQTGTVSVRGKPVEIRALSDAETTRLRKLFPPPAAPLVKDPGAGSLAAKVEDLQNPGYKTAMVEWLDRQTRLEVVCAGGWDGGAIGVNDDASALSGLEQAMVKLSRLLTNAEIERIWHQMRTLFDENAPKRATEALVRPMSEVETAEMEAALEAAESALPERYLVSVSCMKLRLCERFGIKPWELERIGPGWLKLLMAHERIRQKEEARDDGEDWKG